MNKVVLVSTIVDNTIKEYFKDIDIQLFDDVQEVQNYVDRVPIRCSKFIVTSEIADKAPTGVFNIIIGLLQPESNFFQAEEFVFIAQPGSPSLAVLDFVLATPDSPVKNPTIQQGNLSRDFIVSVIKGTYRDKGSTTRFVVERQRRSEFLKSEMKKRTGSHKLEGLEEELISTEEGRLQELDNQPVDMFAPIREDKGARTIQIVGAKERGKTTFLLLLAQFIATNGKVIIIESDFDYFSLSSYLEVSNIEYTKIELELLYKDPLEAAEAVINSPLNLIAIVGKSAYRTRSYSKAFVNRLCFSLFSATADYILLESDIVDMLPATKTVMVLKNELIPILKDIRYIPYQIDQLEFVALAMSSIAEWQIVSSEELTRCVSELLGISIEKKIPIYRIDSSKIGGNIYDLHRYM